jgi:hypothetical protein
MGLEDKINKLISNEDASKYVKFIEEYGENTTEEEREHDLIDLFLDYFSRTMKF